jgi:hypothetical protein
MLTVLATLPFLAALAVAAIAIAVCLHESGAKVLLALRGQSPLAEAALVTRPVTVRFSPRSAPVRRPISAAPRWRAAA